MDSEKVRWALGNLCAALNIVHDLRCTLVRGKASEGTNKCPAPFCYCPLSWFWWNDRAGHLVLSSHKPYFSYTSSSMPGSDRLAHVWPCCYWPALRQPLGGFVPFQAGHLQLSLSLLALCRTYCAISAFPLTTHFPKSSSTSVLFCPVPMVTSPDSCRKSAVIHAPLHSFISGIHILGQ